MQEKKASNVLIDQSKCDAETAVTEAYFILNQSQNEKTTVKAWKLVESLRSKQEVRKERAYSTNQLADFKLIFALNFTSLHGFLS